MLLPDEPEPANKLTSQFSFIRPGVTILFSSQRTLQEYGPDDR